ncbi:hypothetical protein [uncultured Chryseobacterium sp.]|uniref:Acb2/Tad1 domain-containing protein n=1 Tax=uncultured Chryseobacterium sp. TaxID=259322 RepID=UPI0025D0A3C4|nr:hypothetical protein [uncultured Chryseobacterium sp.]
MDKNELKAKFEKEFNDLIDSIKKIDVLDGRCKAIAITNLQTSKMWTLLAIDEYHG